MSERPKRGSAAMWDERYAAESAVYGTEANAFVREVADLIPSGPVLCLAEGQGRNAVFLAERGHEVLAVDQSAVGLQGAQQWATARGVVIRTEVADLAAFDIPPGAWSGIIATFTHLPSDLRRRVFAAAVRGLRPGGLFVLEAFSTAQLGRDSGGPGEVDLLMSLPLLLAELAGLEIVRAAELERVLNEGRHHQGLASVVQWLGRKPAS